MASIFVRELPGSLKFNKILFKNYQIGKRTGVPSFCTAEACNDQKTSTNGDIFEVKIDFGNEKYLTVGSGKLAKLADGCAVVTYKDTTVMATVVSKVSERENAQSFVPLNVHYKQKAAALGRIPMNFLRREISQNEHEILTSRMIDRSIRPLFPEGFNWDTQVICNPLAIDGSNFPDVLAINAASAALAVSDVPWAGPVGAVRIGYIDKEPVVNPSKSELKESQLNMVITARNSKTLIMVESSASNILSSCLLKCIKQGTKECGKIIKGITTLRESVGKPKKEFEKQAFDPDLVSKIESFSEEKLREIFQDYSHHKLSRDDAVTQLYKETLEKIQAETNVKPETVSTIFYKTVKHVFRDLIFEKDIRCDGRSLREMREIKCETNLYEPLHGSALFQRGQTQVLCTVALDSPNSALKMDKINMLSSGIKEKNFFVHYEFPPFATKDTGRVGLIGRREIGHGALAEKALKASVPEDFPFTIRLTSEVLESNGSSSMATVCGGSLALMDAGVPIANPCAGVAMGLVSKYDDKNELTDHRILTDILGIEDYLGDMDFKVAGTKKAFTALQLDVKNNGIPLKIVFDALGLAKESITGVLQIMKNVCPEVRSEKKSNFPEIQTVKIPVHMRSKFLGPGGTNLKKLEAMVGVEIMEDSIGDFIVFAANKDAMKEVNEKISELLKASSEITLEFGAVYTAAITELKESGCMVSLHPNMKPAYIHVSQLDMRKVIHPSALGLQVGDEIKVKYFGRDPVSGAIRLSRKVLMGPASEVVKSFNKLSEEETKSQGSVSGR